MFDVLFQKLPLTKIKVKIASILYFFVTLPIEKKRIIVRDGIRYGVDLTEAVDFSLFFFGSYQKYVVTNQFVFIPPEAIIFDVGANFGIMSLQFAKAAWNGKVYSFEPTHYAFRRLRKNLQLNPHLSKRIVAVKSFVSSQTQRNPRMTAFASWKISGKANAKIHPVHQGIVKSTQGIEAVSLDNFCKKNKINRIDLIKIDTDGYECEVLKGARNIIFKYRPVVIFEIGKYLMEERGVSFDLFMNYFAQANYRLIDIRSKKEVTVQNYLQIIPFYGTTDIVALPCERFTNQSLFSV